MISEVNLVDGSEGWWVDTGASCQVYYDRAMFKSYSNVGDKMVLLDDTHSTIVAGSGKVELNLTHRKTVILKDVLHTPETRKNLPVCTPYDPSEKLFKNIGNSVRQNEYASIIGSLRYSIDCTRPDIAYDVRVLCRFTSKPGNEHWRALERVMHYLKRTMNLGLHYGKFPAVLEGYSDANWNTLFDDSKATSGYIFSIAGGAISWKSKKQTILA
ncbi:hypothetical protein LWI28_025537 [Acer negundo]|uniref:Retrovirus-related Pol polyprotein from transposon TNT 1-94-like beta-barrel domain-containing protein n=1 Tax=Acer negundo TaxID=4023 RepID=A0AAD5J7G3_ACENE|nr:hypothetical protein LWI28_025537 [Acer negundo]